jgi:predicted transcriptional regulator
MDKDLHQLPKAMELMVPIADYATVSHTANLKEAMRALENANKMHGEQPYRHRALLILDDKGCVIGKLSQMDIMRAMEPKYSAIGSNIGLRRFGYSSDYIKRVQDQYGLWAGSLKEIAEVLDRTKVTDVMYKPADHQRVKETDTLTTAIHQIVMGQHQSLLVIRGEQVVGILRSTDAFNALFGLIDL